MAQYPMLVRAPAPLCRCNYNFKWTKIPNIGTCLSNFTCYKKCISDGNIFDIVAASAAGEIYVENVIQRMQAVRKIFLELFKIRFKGMPEEVLWISQLDPRFADMNYLDENEKLRGKEQFLQAMFQMSRLNDSQASTNNATQNLLTPNDKNYSTTKNKYLKLALGRELRTCLLVMIRS